MFDRILDSRTSKHIQKKKKIILAVTGHRVLKHSHSQLTLLIKSKCNFLRKVYPGHLFVILTGLAEGADRVVAEIVMKELKAELIVVLALPRQNFMLDFKTPQSRRVFRTLLAKAKYIITAPMLSEKEWQSYSPSRDHQYAWEGAFLARHADVLFALWDGTPAKGIGGTAHVVRWFRRGRVPKKYLVQSDALARKAGLSVFRCSSQKRLIHIEI